jgi:hypothetical protein
MNRNLELRMYGLVPYNISPIQQAIQFGHAVVEYGQKVKEYNQERSSIIYNEWANNWKTFIILNGGTTNHRNDDEGLPFGSLNQHVLKLDEMKIDFATFNEPDLGDQLTAVVFIVDERVFNRKKYPDFSDWLMNSKYADLIRAELGENVYTISENIKNSNNKEDKKAYNEWSSFVGGEKNVFLRDFLKNFKLA